MLYPQTNSFRQRKDLSGYWDFRIDEQGLGESDGWSRGFSGHPIAVPASWNDQFADLRDYLGFAWHQTRFDLPWGWEGQPIMLRFGSVNYLADVWLNGVFLGSHEGGHLPFEFAVTPHLRAEDNLLVVRVDGSLARDRVPPGLVTDPADSHQIGNLPPTTYDFFPYCGIHRPVLLYTMPPGGIKDLTVVTEIGRAAPSRSLDGRVLVRGRRSEIGGRKSEVGRSAPSRSPTGGQRTMRVSISGHGIGLSGEAEMVGTETEVELSVPDAALWSPDAPNLYDLTVELLDDGEVYDRYTLPIGIRSIEVDGDKLLLNGQPIVLRGFGRHEDFPVTGRGEVPAVIIKDFALMTWIGANSFRTAHYPYSEEMLALADRLGFLVISETAAVGLFFQEEGLERRLQLCEQYTRELIERDKNHPSVIAWSLANEPRSLRPAAVPFFRTLYDLAKSLDDTRPITIVSDLFTAEASFEFFDLVCLNIYRGWYQESGQLEAGFEQFARILDETHAAFGKPILVTEFGADAIPGHHALPPEMFSEEYQADFLQGYIEVMDARPFVVGQHVWNMCDFKTAQGVKRPMALNFKGVFTRDRRPKMAAHRLRELWRDRSIV